MYAGYVFLCDDSSMKECLNRRLYTCSADMDVTDEIGEDSVVFFFNADSGSLVGPFSLSESDEAPLEPGTWVEELDEQSVSGNFRVEWEELHELKQADAKFPFLRNGKTCKLTNVETQSLLNELREAPLFQSA